MLKKTYSLFLMLSLLFVGVNTFKPINVYASEFDFEEAVEKYTINNLQPVETPYLVYVLQLGINGQDVRMFSDFADSDRNITTETQLIHLEFNFISQMITKHTYFKIVEDSLNLTILNGDMGKGGREYTFNVPPKTFRPNQSYTIYHAYGSNSWKPIGRFKVNS